MTSLAMMSAVLIGCADAGLSLGAAPPPAPAVVAAAQPAAATTATPERAPAPASGGGAAMDAAPETLAFAGETDDAVAARALAYLDAITTFTADFTQIAPSGAVSTGKFYLRRPGLLRFEYDAPSPLLIVATGGTVFVRDAALETTDSYPVGKTPLKFLLRKKVDFGDFDVVAVDRGVDSVAITFASPQDETEGELSIILSAPELMLSEWIVRDPQNGVTIVALEDAAEGGPIANRLFAAPQASTPFLKN